ncbi:ribonuclease T2 family protein [Pseudomonas sp. S1_E04]
MKFSASTLAAIVLILECNAVQALDNNEEITPANKGEYWVYSVTWQPSFCKLKPKTTGCTSPPARFLTHGIWPYNHSTQEKTNRHPAFCSCEQGTACEISSSDLKEIAGNPAIAKLVTPEPEGMFKHEWEKHGTCSGKTKEEYFNDIFKLRHVVRYNESMFEGWVGDSVTFDQLKKAFPDNASFRCFEQDGKQYLHEVFYRITDQGKPYEGDPSLQIGIPCKSQPTFVPDGA